MRAAGSRIGAEIRHTEAKGCLLPPPDSEVFSGHRSRVCQRFLRISRGHESLDAAFKLLRLHVSLPAEGTERFPLRKRMI